MTAAHCPDCAAAGATRCTPAMCERVTSRAYSPDQCRRCWERFFGGKPAAAPAAPPPPVCAHRSEVPLTGSRRAALDLDHRREWFDCDHPGKPLGAVVCPCRGCGPTCAGYSVPPPAPAPDPWAYPVAVAIPHLDTPEQMEVATALWRAQSARPYLIVVDTGSPPESLRRVEALRGPDCEVHALRPGKGRHPSAVVAKALDAAQAVCPPEYLLHTHTDVFPLRRDFLAMMLSLCSPENPVVGWRMSPRVRGEWSECVSHTATMVHVPTARRKGLCWSMGEFFRDHPAEVGQIGAGWPDTESGFLGSMRRAGVTPVILGDEKNFERHTLATADGTAWAEHARSYTGLKLDGKSPRWEAARQYMAAAMADANARLREWRKS